MKKILKYLFYTILITCGIYILSNFSVQAEPPERTFSSPIGAPASGEIYYDTLCNTPAYLCAKHGSPFFNKGTESVTITVDFSIGGGTTTTIPLDSYNAGKQQQLLKTFTSAEYTYSQVENNPQFVLKIDAIAFTGQGYVDVPPVNNPIVTSQYGFVTFYTSGKTIYRPADSHSEKNNFGAYILADCDDNVGPTSGSYVQHAFWQWIGQGGVGGISAADLADGGNATPAGDDMLEEYKSRLQENIALSDEDLNVVGKIFETNLEEQDEENAKQILENYKENSSNDNNKQELIKVMESTIEQTDVNTEISNVVGGSAGSLIQQGSDFQEMWNRINAAGGYENSIQNLTNMNGIETKYNSDTKRYTIGPFKISYVQCDSSGYQLAGITGTPMLTVNEDGGSVTLAQGEEWDFEYNGGYHTYPNSEEEFYINIKYKEGRNAITNIHFDFRYMTASASWTRSIGSLEKVRWMLSPEREGCIGGTCDGGAHNGGPGNESHDHPGGLEKHYHNYKCVPCPGHRCSGGTEDKACNWGTKHESPKTHYHNYNCKPCPGHFCIPKTKCEHGFYAIHNAARFYVEYKGRVDGEIAIQDVATCHGAERHYVYTSKDIPLGNLPPPTPGGDPPPGGGDPPPPPGDMTTTLAGNVWLDDDPQKANSAINGVMAGSEQKVKNVAVRVYLYKQDGTKLGPAIAHTKSGQRINWPVYTDNNGYYEIYRLEPPGSNQNVNRLFYVVEFEYDGQVMKSTVYMANSRGQQGTSGGYNTITANSYADSSMAVERVDNRSKFDQSFGEITGDSGISSSLQTNGYTKTTDLNGNGASGSTGLSYNGKSENGKIVSELDSAVHINGENRITQAEKTEGKYDRYKMYASTYYDQSATNGVSVDMNNFRIQYPLEGFEYILNQRKEGHSRYISDYMKHINLGLQKRKETDISVLKDLYKVTLVVNEQKVTKEYNNLGNVSSGNNLDDFLINVEQNRGNGTYTLGLYNSDYEYQSGRRYANAIDKVLDIKKGTELKVYVTYVIRGYNNSETNDVEINEITDYYDTSYTLVTSDTYASIVNEDLKRENQLVAESPYYRIIPAGQTTTWKPTKSENLSGFARNGNFQWSDSGSTGGMKVSKMNAVTSNKLALGECLELFTTYEIDQAGYNSMVNGGTASTARQALLGEKNNIVEISNYSTYYTQKDLEGGTYQSYKAGFVSGRVDRDSAPNNIDRNNLKNRSMHEDDTYLAIPLGVRLQTNERDMYGYVWDDKKTENVGRYNMTVGNGYYDNGETLIPNVEVALYEVINLGQVNSSGAYDGTYDGLEYYYKVPSQFYYHTTERGSAEGPAITTSSNVRNINGQTVNGNYCIGGFLAGDYILRYDYGTKSEDGSGIIKYNGQDYENTRFMAQDTDSHLNDKFLDLTGKTKIAGTDINNLSISKARDNESRRMVVDAYSRTIENDRAQILEAKGNKSPEEYIQSTKMFAETPVMQIEIEDPKILTQSQTPGGTSSSVEKVVEFRKDNSYTITNIGLGLEERAKTDIALEKYIDRIILQKSGETLFSAVLNEDGTVITDHADSAFLEKLTYLPHTKTNTNTMGVYQQGFYALTVEDDFLKDLSLLIKYKIKVLNKSEVDFTGALAGYYIDKDIVNSASETPTSNLYKLTIRNLEQLDKQGIGISSNSSLAEILRLYRGETVAGGATLGQLLDTSRTVDETDTLRPEVIVYGRYVGRYYYENYLKESAQDYKIVNYSKNVNAADIDVSYAADKIVKTTVDQIIEYIDINTSLDLDENTRVENNSWELIPNLRDGGKNQDGTMKSLTGIVSKASYKRVDGNVNIFDEKNRELVTQESSNIAISLNEKLTRDPATGRTKYNKTDTLSSYNNTLTKQLEPENYGKNNSIGEIYVTTRKNNSSDTDANEMKMDNLAEVLIYSNPVGRRDTNSMPGNAMEIGTNYGFWHAGYNSKSYWDATNPSIQPENDAYSPEYVSIITPTGIPIRILIRQNITKIIGLIVIIILLGAVFIYKQRKIKQKK